MRKSVLSGLVLVGAVGISVAIVGWSRTPAASSSTQADRPAQPRTATKLVATAAAAKLPSAELTRGDQDDEVTGLLAAAVGATDSKERSRIFWELVNALRRNPELLGPLERMLAQASPDSEAVRMALTALVVVGTPEAQMVTLELLSERADDDAFLSLLVPTMGFFKQPTEALENGLRTLAASDAEHPQTMARLALGAIADNMKDSQPGRTQRIVDEFASKLADASADAKKETLTVLGNIGAPATVVAVTPYLNAEDPQVRGKALEALRLVHNAEANGLLLEAVSRDADAGVRGSAAWALSYQQPMTEESISAQASALTAETNEAVAIVLLKNIWSSVNLEHDLVISIVSRTATSHALPTVRDAAHAMLAQASAG
jgi:HEAT repeat protein